MGVAASGALVNDVPEGPSKEAGIQQGDIIIRFNGVDVETSDALVKIVADSAIGSAVPVDVLRKDESGAYTELKLSVTLGRREDAEAAVVNTAAPGLAAPTTGELLGMTLEVLSDEVRAQMGLADDVQGLVITDIDPASAVAAKGLTPGLVITEAGQLPVTSIADFEKRVSDARDAGRKSLLVLLKTGQSSQFMALPITE